MGNLDRSLDGLLDLNGLILVVDELAGHWVKFDVWQVPASVERPHGLSYSLTLHAASGERLAGFDNAHKVKGSKETQDHIHRFKTVKPYEYKDAAALLEDFWAVVDVILKERGIL